MRSRAASGRKLFSGASLGGWELREGEKGDSTDPLRSSHSSLQGHFRSVLHGNCEDFIFKQKIDHCVPVGGKAEIICGADYWSM